MCVGDIGVPNIKNILCAQRLKFLAKVLAPGDENWKPPPPIFFLNLTIDNKAGIITCNKPVSEHCIPHFYKSCLLDRGPPVSPPPP